MAKNRMAGEKLDEPTKESSDAKQALSNSERNKQIREEIGNDPERLAQRISGVDREKYDFDGYTDKEINMAMQGGTFDENDYARLTGKSLDSDKPETKPEKPEPDVTIQPVDETKPAPEPKPYVPPKPEYQGIGGGYGPGMNVNQNNDINSNVTGDNNTVNNNQDNSIRSFGAYGTADRAKMLRDRYVADVSRFVRAW